MSQSTQSLTIHDVSTAGFSSNGNVDSAGNGIVRQAKEAVNLALAHTAAALATGEKDIGAQPEFPRAAPIQELASDSLSRILDFPQLRVPAQPNVTFHAIQEWEGYVIEIGGTDFLARLVDLTAGAEYEEEEALIPLVEISDDDAAGMQLGSIFRWVIGYERSASGTKKRVSQIVFRDLPVVTKSDLSDGEAWANEIIRSLDL
ncbi:MAG: hypothetical protein F4Z91_00915 [Acidimicrobiia bacterium]|nr:hypothetical protein [Acidimicrobiia bacterium]